MIYHVKRHADTSWALYRDGVLIAVFDTYSEALQRLEAEKEQEQSKQTEVPP
jgi:hypothetical protein